jgi:hypothetical protein
LYFLLGPNQFPLSEFAGHVYTCIKQLDDVERIAQEELDAKLAARMNADVVEQAQLIENSHFIAPTICPDGEACCRTDSQHFLTIQHPEVFCPICNNEFPVYEVNAHVTLWYTKTKY